MSATTKNAREEAALELSIWDKMVLEERKLEAEKRGVRVCDLEEEVSLSLAIEESSVLKQISEQENKTKKNGSQSTTNNSSNSHTSSSSRNSNSSSIYQGEIEGLLSPSDISTSGTDEKGGNEVEGDDDEKEGDRMMFEDEDGRLSEEGLSLMSAPLTRINTASASATETAEEQELSIWQLYLPQELSNKILTFLGDVDMCGYLLQVGHILVQ